MRQSQCGLVIDSEGYLKSNQPTSDGRPWNYANSNWFVELEPGDYTISGDILNPNLKDTGSFIVYNTSNQSLCGINLQNKERVELHFNLQTKQTVGMYMKIYNSRGRIKLEKGLVATPWSEYNKDDYNICLTISNKNILEFPDLSAYGVTYHDGNKITAKNVTNYVYNSRIF